MPLYRQFVARLVQFVVQVCHIKQCLNPYPPLLGQLVCSSRTKSPTTSLVTPRVSCCSLDQLQFFHLNLRKQLIKMWRFGKSGQDVSSGGDYIHDPFETCWNGGKAADSDNKRKSFGMLSPFSVTWLIWNQRNRCKFEGLNRI
ncbi:hypothetical protein Acr_04g0006880 [Actinidia rufa]|uniref:Uncharacterized protein n=1 Tax=Actinidia rufa TaxID=165716 RepID=A0A7J0EHU7_9ERIC|nr:hypothetical protein Acr_04g0006880 [Actinidia rufa]